MHFLPLIYFRINSILEKNIAAVQRLRPTAFPLTTKLLTRLHTATQNPSPFFLSVPNSVKKIDCFLFSVKVIV